jgi:two-component system chemotaxis response regulator CheB
MPVKVLVVDDSAFFRRRIKEMLEKNSDIRVIGAAENGRDAIAQAERLKPDVITMDYEMPLMDGITAVREIMARCPTPILMFSSLTYEGARVTLDALEAGAMDYLPKSFESMSNSPGESVKMLQDRVTAIARSPRRSVACTPTVVAPAPASVHAPAPSTRSGGPIAGSALRSAGTASRDAPQPTLRPVSAPRPAVTPAGPAKSPPPAAMEKLRANRPRLVIIGASTGGPVALQKVLEPLPAQFPYPILLVQHMPGTFTAAFAQRLNRICQIEVREAKDNDPLRPGVALLAPGGKQMLVDASGQAVNIVEGSERLQYRPSVDVTLGSAARIIKGRVLAMVLTGMGSDGKEGARMLKREGAVIWSQDEASCVVFGMPAAVEKSGFSDAVMTPEMMAVRLRELV